MKQTVVGFLSPAKAGSFVLGRFDPGLRSLRSLTRGYHLPPLHGWLISLADAGLKVKLI